MSGVLTDAVGRQDVLLRRGAVTEWAIRWTNSIDGVEFVPVDLDGDKGTLELRSLSGDVWLTRMVTGTADGFVLVTLTPDDFTGAEWAARSGGAWLVTLTHDGRVERLADGNFYLED